MYVIWNETIFSKNFDLKYMWEESYVIGIKIHKEISQGILGLSQEIYINSFREVYLKNCSQSLTLIVKDDKLELI